MDELLYEHLTQLKTIEDRVERIERKASGNPLAQDLRQLLCDIADAIRKAEESYASF